MTPFARPYRSAPHRALVASLVASFALAVGAACSTGARRAERGGGEGPVSGAYPEARRGAGDAQSGDGPASGGGLRTGPGTTRESRSGQVSLSDKDLAPIDGYIKNRGWILGDVVEVVASKEYFVQYISIAARIGLVKRVDSEDDNGMTSVVTFLGSPEQLDVSTAPRLLIGTGITVSARQKLVLRFARTRNPDVPVRLRITAQGKARQGVGDKTLRKEESIVIGVGLRRAAGGGWQYEEQ